MVNRAVLKSLCSRGVDRPSPLPRFLVDFIRFILKNLTCKANFKSPFPFFRASYSMFQAEAD